MTDSYEDMPSTPVSTRSTEDLETGSWRALRPCIDQEKCIRCYICWKYCPDMAIEVDEEGDFPRVNLFYCKGCGICAKECPKDAIEMEREESG